MNSLFGADNKFMNQVATKYLVNLFDGESLFTSPKPVEFVEKLVRYFSDENSIILDFFGDQVRHEAVIEANIKEKQIENILSFKFQRKLIVLLKTM